MSGRIGQQLGDALLHLFRCLVGEGDRSNVARGKAAAFDQISDFLRNHPRFARAGTCQHQQGAVEVMDCFALLGVEAGHGVWGSENAAPRMDRGGVGVADFNLLVARGRQWQAGQPATASTAVYFQNVDERVRP